MIRPVELSDALSKAEVAGKLNQMQKAHSEMEQRQFAAALKEKISVDAERTHETEKTDSVIISKDKQQQEEKQKEKDKEKEDESGNDDKEEEGPPQEHLDITA
jgi:hypothetical protein